MNKETFPLTPLSKFGKIELTNHLMKKYAGKQSEKNNEQEIATIALEHKEIATNSSLLIENIHFDLSYFPLKHLGFKAVVGCVSKFYGHNLQAKAITVSVGVSNRFSLEALEDLFEGIQTSCEAYNIDLTAIEVTSSNKGLIVCINAFSDVDQSALVSKNTSSEGDLVVVTGDLGGAYLGLQVLKREKAVFEVNPTSQPDLNTYKYIVQRQLKPSARKDMIELLASLEVKPTAMSAMSDGLASELAQISKKSKLGFAIYEDKMPIAPETLTVCEEFQLNPMTVVLNGGEDYELLFTISQNDYAKIKGNPHLTVIGHMTKEAEGTFLISKANQKIDLANNSFHEGA